MSTSIPKPDPTRTILVDCDGVLVDWETKFHNWMRRHGYLLRDDAEQHYRVSDRFHDITYQESKRLTRFFNESAAIANMPPLRDSVYWVKRLNWKMGFRFHVITSLSHDPDAQYLRRHNLLNLYGDIFDRVLCLDTGSDKDEILEQYRDTGCWWIEDKPENAMAGLVVGLKPILMKQGHNQRFSHAEIPVAPDWQTVYSIIYDSA